MRRLFGFVIVLFLAFACNKDVITLTSAEQLEYDIEIIDEYLAEKGITALSHESGLRYTISQTGPGPMPTANNCIRFLYTGWVLDAPEPFQVNVTDGIKVAMKNQITGFRIGMKLVPKGSKFTFYIPSGLAYGPNPTTSTREIGIGPNAILKFDIELVEIYEYNAAAGYCYQ